MKKLVALLLCLGLACALPMMVSASDPKIEDFRDNQTLMNGYLLSGSGRVKTDRDKQTVTYTKVLEPGYRDYINLTSDLFQWEDSNSAVLTTDVLRDNTVSVHTVFAKGQEAVQGASIDYRNRQIVIQYASNLAATEPVEFEFNLHVTIRGRRYRDHGITFRGSIENPVITVNDATSLNLIDGSVVEAKTDITKIRLKLGDATLTTNLAKGSRCYAASTSESLPAGNKLVQQHAGLSKTVTLHTAGLSSADTTVKLNKEYKDYYIYDKNMNYLGKGDELLPYHSKYYLASKKLKT